MDAFKWLLVSVAAFFGYIAYSINSPSAAAGFSLGSNGDSAVVAADTRNFNAVVLDSATPVLLEFYADW